MYATPLELHPRSGAELQRLYQDLIVENDTYHKKSEFMKQSSWYSIVKLIHKQDHVWHARRWQAERVAQLLTGNKGKQIAKDLVTAMMKKPGVPQSSPIPGWPTPAAPWAMRTPAPPPQSLLTMVMQCRQKSRVWRI